MAVYFIECNGKVKIGFSQDPEIRLSNFQTGNPEELKLLGHIPEYGREEESLLHSMFSEYHYRGEWFVLSNPVRNIIDRITKKNKNNFVNSHKGDNYEKQIQFRYNSQGADELFGKAFHFHRVLTNTLMLGDFLQYPKYRWHKYHLLEFLCALLENDGPWGDLFKKITRVDHWEDFIMIHLTQKTCQDEEASILKSWVEDCGKESYVFLSVRKGSDFFKKEIRGIEDIERIDYVKSPYSKENTGRGTET